MDTVIRDGEVMVEMTCSECGGEGVVEVAVPGGYFSSSQEQWYPDEEMRECEDCHGLGVVYIAAKELEEEEEPE
jgi:DnaJ-class molecular chaperone